MSEVEERNSIIIDFRILGEDGDWGAGGPKAIAQSDVIE